jgi:protein-histidine pros-kinase
VKLIWKFNLVLIAIFGIGFIVAGYVSNVVLQRNARDEITQNARMMMEAASASRTYTSIEVRPLIEAQLQKTFLPQSVPAYAATAQFNEMRKVHPEYSYKEATLNPTNPRNRASDWEADIVNEFRNRAEHTELIGERDTPLGRALYLARPIRITRESCLDCHNTPAEAPKPMLDLYGDANGFGWKMNEVIGAQVVSVSMSVPIARAEATLKTFLLALGGVFALVFVALNVMLYTIVIRRVTHLSELADAVSLGRFDVGEFQARSKDEIGVLTQALARMKTSLVQAIRMLDE